MLRESRSGSLRTKEEKEGRIKAQSCYDIPNRSSHYLLILFCWTKTVHENDEQTEKKGGDAQKQPGGIQTIDEILVAKSNKSM